MAGREKRKRRKIRERRREGAGGPPEAASADGGPEKPQPPGGPARAVARESARVEAGKRSKDDLAREQLEPLSAGERPRAVTVAAIVAALIAISNIIAFAAGLEVEDTRPRFLDIVFTAGLMLLTAVGMWYARYWAVLGFQALLAILIILMSLLLLRAESVVGVIVALTIIAACGTLFWFLVKSLARIQMPERRTPGS